MEKPAEDIKVIPLDRLKELAGEYVKGLTRSEAILGHRYVISTGDKNENDFQRMGFLQFLKKKLDEG